MENKKNNTKIKEQIKRNTAITLVALVVTVVVLLILAGVSLNLVLGNNGIINKASEAKKETEESTEKEKIELATTSAQITGNSYGELSQSSLQSSIDNQFGNGKATVTDNGDETFTVKMNDSVGRSYTVEENGEIIEGTYDKWDGTSATEPAQMTSTEIHITKASELKWLANQVNDSGIMYEGLTIYLDSNLDLGAREIDGSWENTANEAVEWTAIGKVNNTNMLKATFEGNNHIIKGVYINTDTKFNGIFGNSNTIQNLTIKNSYIKGANCTAGIIGALRTGKVENCHNINTSCILIEGENYTVGGVVGQLSAEMINCYNTGTVSSTGYYTGGVVGRVITSSTISNCYNTGTVSSTGDCTGGIVGILSQTAEVTNCYNTGKVSGEQRTGGIVGDLSQTAEVTNCYNTGNITGTNINTGGVVGITFGIVDNVYNTGTVTGNGTKTGGIIGQVTCLDTDHDIRGTLKNSYNIGKVTDTGSYVGGVTGYNCGTVENTYSLNTTSILGVGETNEYTIKNDFTIKTSDEMKTQNFISLLGNENWEIQIDKNNGYPILNWQ